MGDSQKTGTQDSDCKLDKDVLSPSNSWGGMCRSNSHISMLEAVSAPVPTGNAWRLSEPDCKRTPQPPLELTYFYVKKNTCLEAMPTSSVWGKRVPSLTQGQNYAWQPCTLHNRQDCAPPQLSSGWGGGKDPNRSCQEAVRSLSSPCPLGSAVPTNSQSQWPVHLGGASLRGG